MRLLKSHVELDLIAHSAQPPNRIVRLDLIVQVRLFKSNVDLEGIAHHGQQLKKPVTLVIFVLMPVRKFHAILDGIVQRTPLHRTNARLDIIALVMVSNIHVPKANTAPLGQVRLGIAKKAISVPILVRKLHANLVIIARRMPPLLKTAILDIIALVMVFNIHVPQANTVQVVQSLLWIAKKAISATVLAKESSAPRSMNLSARQDFSVRAQLVVRQATSVPIIASQAYIALNNIVASLGISAQKTKRTHLNVLSAVLIATQLHNFSKQSANYYN